MLSIFTLLLNIFTADCLCHTAEMKVLETVWKLQTLAINDHAVIQEDATHT